jgi:hypothetical protein
MREPHERGPEVDAHEELFRLVAVHFVRDGQVSSGAFSYDYFSIEVASRTAGPADSLSRVPSTCAVIQFNCGCARRSGLDARDERDEAHPENLAHAHVYQDGPAGERKRRVKSFMTSCSPIIVHNTCPPEIAQRNA